MAAVFAKNELVAAKRRALVVVYQNDGYTLADRGSSFTGSLFVGQSTSTLVAATGTMTNVRRPLTVTDDVVDSVDTVADTLTLTGHSYETGDGPFTSDEAIGALTIGTEFYIISVDANTIAIAESLTDAYAGTKLALTGTETGATISDAVDTERGVDGYFIYEATQSETDFDGSEFLIVVSGGSFLQSVTTVNMQGAVEGFETTAEGAHTYGDLIRLAVGVLAGKVTDFTTGTLVFKSLDGSKTRVTITSDATGRLTCTIGDLT